MKSRALGTLRWTHATSVLTRAGLVVTLLASCASPPNPDYPWHEAPFASNARNRCKVHAECVDACNQGDFESCEYLGYLYETGTGLEQSYPRAVTHYQQACDGGRGESCTRLGVMYDIGLSVRESPRHAAQLYERACSLGHAWACRRVKEIE